MNWRPALRRDLVALTASGTEPGGQAGLYDPLLDRRVNLGRISQTIVGLVDGEREVGQILAEAAAITGEVDPEVLGRTLRTLLLMLIFEGTGEEVLALARAARAQQGQPRPLYLPETGFGCQGSGDCCQSYSFGPLQPADLERLTGLADEIARAFPHLQGAYLEERTVLGGAAGQGGQRRHYLRAKDMRCVFHLDDGRCGIHAHLGEEQKPGFCRLYPWQDYPTIAGLKIYDRGECANFGTSARAGKRLADDLPRVLALLPERPVLEHPLLLLPEGGVCDFGHFLTLVDVLCEGLARHPGGPAEALADVGAGAATFFAALGEVPLEAGQPDRRLAEVLGRIAAAPRVDAGPGDAERARPGLRSIAGIAAELLHEVRWAAALADYNPGQRFHFQQLKDFAQTTSQLAGLARAAVGEEEAPEPGEQAAVIVAAADPDERWDVLRRSLRSQIFGRLALIEQHPVAGLLRIAIGYLLAEVRAQMLAAARGATTYTLGDLDAGHKMVMRILTQSSLAPVFLRREDEAFAVLAALPALVVAAPAGDRAAPGAAGPRQHLPILR